MKRAMVMVAVLMGFAGGVHAATAMEQLNDSSSNKAIPAPATALLSADKVCSPEIAKAQYLKLLNQGNRISNLKINASSVQFGNDKSKIAVIGNYERETPAFDYGTTIPMAGYAFYDAETCVLGENLNVKIHDEQAVLSAEPAGCSLESAEANYITSIKQGSRVSNLKIKAATVQFGNNKQKIVVVGSYDRETPAFDYTTTIPMAGYAFYDAETCAVGENLNVMVRDVK